MDIEVLKTKLKLESVQSKLTTNEYRITLTWDENDADYVPVSTTFAKAAFEGNVLLQTVLSFVSTYKGSLFGDDWNSSIYGHHIIDNTDIPGVVEYLETHGLVAYTHYEGDHCHSVSGVLIEYFDSEGKAHLMSLTPFDDLFDTKEDAIETLNNMIDAYIAEDD
jgi:hypothetical protein